MIYILQYTAIIICLVTMYELKLLNNIELCHKCMCQVIEISSPLADIFALAICIAQLSH